jgi:hypothetical protein
MRKFVNTGLLRAIEVCGINAKEDVEERNGLVAELNDERREQSTNILLSDVLEIEEEESYVRRPSVADITDILNDCGPFR